MAGRRASSTVGFDAARAVVEVLHEALGVSARGPTAAADARLHPGKAAVTPAGLFGELHPAAARGLVGRRSSSTSRRSRARVPERTLYEDVITYPAVRQDIAVVVDEKVTAGDLVAVVRAGGRPDAAGGDARSTSSGASSSGRGGSRSPCTFRSRRTDRTLSDAEVAPLREAIVAMLGAKLGAVLRAG